MNYVNPFFNKDMTYDQYVKKFSNDNHSDIVIDYLDSRLLMMEDIILFISFMRAYGILRPLREFIRTLRYTKIYENSILDVGSRDGSAVKMLEFLGFAKVDGIDIMQENVDFCKKNGINNVHCMDAHKMDFGDHSFDAVFSRNCLEHVFDIGKVMSEILRVLRPGGIIYLVYPPLHKHGNKIPSVADYTDTPYSMKSVLVKNGIDNFVSIYEGYTQAIGYRMLASSYCRKNENSYTVVLQKRLRG